MTLTTPLFTRLDRLRELIALEVDADTIAELAIELRAVAALAEAVSVLATMKFDTMAHGPFVEETR